MNRWQRKNHEKALDDMTRRILEGRRNQPQHSTHGAAVRTTHGTHQIAVPATVPESELRAYLESQLAVINAREGS